MKFFKYSLIPLLFVLPVLASAQLGGTQSLFMEALGIVRNILIPIAFSLALLYFFWGVAKYIKSEGDGKAEGQKIMVWGVVALFVMSSVWGLVYFLREELLSGLGWTPNMDIPTINVPGNRP